jgi:hypothetical protein
VSDAETIVGGQLRALGVAAAKADTVWPAKHFEALSAVRRSLGRVRQLNGFLVEKDGEKRKEAEMMHRKDLTLAQASLRRYQDELERLTSQKHGARAALRKATVLRLDVLRAMNNMRSADL